MGVILFALCTGSLPFDNENIRDLFEQIKGAIYRYPRPLPLEITSFIDSMLQVVGGDRVSMLAMRTTPWFLAQLPRLPTHLKEAWRVHHNTLSALPGGGGGGGRRPSNGGTA